MAMPAADSDDSLLGRLGKHAPPPPLLAAGALGGPIVIGSLTPLRNAMSNAAQDQKASFSQLFAKVGGSTSRSPLQWLRTAYTGARASALPACPQWCTIGPAFHVFHSVLPTPVALLTTASLETVIAYGSQSRNAQLAYNVQVATEAPSKVVQPLFGTWRPWGPGAPFFVLRNACGMAGIRWLSPPCQAALEPVLPSGPRELCADMAASTLTCLVSAPLNTCWAYTVTTPNLWTMSLLEQATALVGFLRRQYLEETEAGATRVSRLAMRDLSVRVVYIAACFSMFSSIERLAVKYWPRPDSSEPPRAAM